jgi:signal transduction histidine kinase
MQLKKSPCVYLITVGVMLFATAAVGLAFWYPLQRAQKAHIQRVTRFAVQSVKTDIADEIRSQLVAQIQVAQLYGITGTFSRKEWYSYAGIFAAHHPGYLAFLVTDNALHVRFSLSQEAAKPYLDTLFAPKGPLEQALRGDSSRREVMLSPAVFLRNGESGHAVIAPIYHGGKPQGFVIAILDDRQFLADALVDQEGLGYAFSVSEDKQELYRTRGDDDSRNEKRWGQVAEITLSDTTWSVRVWPQATLLGEVEPRLPKLALLMGSVIGMLLASTLILAWAAHVRSQQLSHARDTLELRVQERTSELKSANSALKTEVCERTRAEQSLQELSGRLLQLRDEEQRRIAREIHDGTVQTLGALEIDLEKALRHVPGGDSQKVQKLLTNSCGVIEQVITELRTMSYLLHPPMLDDLGLADVLPWYAAGFASRSGINVSVDVQSNFGRLPHELELTLYRIVQEGLANIHHHSGSPTAEITLARDAHQVTLQIADYGRGIPRGVLGTGGNAGIVMGVGIAGMRERVRQLKGQLQIDSGDNGTSLTATLPILSTTPGPEQSNEGGDTDSSVVSKEH